MEYFLSQFFFFCPSKKIKLFQKNDTWIQSDQKASRSDFSQGGCRWVPCSLAVYPHTPSAALRLGKSNGSGIWTWKAQTNLSPEVLKEVTFPSWPQVNQAETKRQLYLLSCLPRKFKTAAGLSRSLGKTAERESVSSQGLCHQDKVISLRMYINTYPEMGKQM